MQMEGLSLICAGLGVIEEDKDGNRIGYSKDEYCLDNLKDLLRFLRRDDPHTRDVFKQVCKWNIVSKDLIPIIEHCQEDRNLLLNAVKVLVFITMPIEPSSTHISQQLEYLWELKASITSSDIVAVTASFLEGPLENLESDAFTEDDWKLVQLVLTFFRNILAVQEISLQHKSGGSASQLLSLRDRFLELLFRENVLDIILVIINYAGGSNAFLRQDNLLLLEILHYIFLGQEPELIVRAHLDGLKADEDSQVPLNSLKSVMEEEAEKRRRCRLNSMIRHSQFSGTFARLTMDGSKAVFKGNPSSCSLLHKSQNVTRGPAKKIAWDHPKFLPTKDKILELLYGFINQFLSGGYNALMQSIREDVEKEHPAIQRGDVIVFFEVAEFVTSFQFYKYSASKMNNGKDPLEAFDDKDTLGTDFNGQICGPVAATMNEAMFQVVLSKWRHVFDGLKETNDYKFLSAAGSLMKNMILMLDLVLKLLPEDSKEPQTARILLYKLFYDQTEEGMTQFLLNLMKTFDTHKQPRSDLADLVEIIHKVVKLLENLQARGTLRVSRKLRKVRKKSFQDKIETGDKLCRDHSCAENEVGDSGSNQLFEKKMPDKDYVPSRNSDGEEDFVDPDDDSQHEKIVEEDDNSLGNLEQIDFRNSEHASGGLLHGTGDFSNDEQQTEYNEVDFKVSHLVSAFANHNIIQKICWLLKFYKSNSLATNHYIICILQRICDDLELHPMLYQLSLLTTFYDILLEQRKCPSQKYANIVDFLTNLIRKMLKMMKKQPLLFVDILFWKTRRESHYMNAEYLLDELNHLKKESTNLSSIQVEKLWTRRSLADALGDDEADVVITHDLGYQNGEQLIEDESVRAPRQRKRLHLDGELERQIKDLTEKFKDDQHCSSRIAQVLDSDGKLSGAQISRQLKKLGLSAPRKKTGNPGEHHSTSTSQFEGEGSTKKDSNLHKLLNSEQNPLGQHLPKRKRVHAFSEDQESLIRALYEQFKDHRRCCYKIASALDMDGKFTSRQVFSKLKQLGLSVPRKKNLKGNMYARDEDLRDSFTDKADGKKMQNGKISWEELHKNSTKEKLSKDDSDDEMLCSVLKKKMDNSSFSTEKSLEKSSQANLSDINADDEMLGSVFNKNWPGLSNSHQVEYQQVLDELMDSEDDEAARALPDNAVCRRKLRMIIDPEDVD
ncbi:protein timeless homolog isoform X2 [Neltuma alba]|uniref:protein timeless homolog isoform X2 n=1 Tax=Neltuma alba TaxID=207710 RepID=UPI0010A503D6|nr:protein timeless homolog isoform X2 [Prosopis alba]